LLAWILCRFIVRREKDSEYAKIQRQNLLEERERITSNLHDVMRVLNAKAGGISKRIYESTEIAEAIEQNAPELFKQCFGLVHWLHANDQFLKSLYSVTAPELDVDHFRRHHYMQDYGRDEVFERIYVLAGLPFPGIHIR
jgi:hypothetical protein